ncbi:MAG: carbohydrate ABC transporter permease, partial [Opitutaceae bacterium]|nr:carbohydrate ABC transporter permease [Opitutaceae bacterium]
MSHAPVAVVGSRISRDWSKHVVILCFLVIELFPLYMMLQVSLKDNSQFTQSPWFPSPPCTVTEVVHEPGVADRETSRIATWRETLGGVRPSSPAVIAVSKHFDVAHYHHRNWIFGLKLIGPYIANTVFVAVTGTIGTIFFAILGAYFFARYKMPFSGVLWSAFLVIMLLPSVANIVPLFTLLKELSLLNTLWALIIVG